MSYRLTITPPAERQLANAVNNTPSDLWPLLNDALLRLGTNPPRPHPLVEVMPGRLRYDFVLFEDDGTPHLYVVAYRYAQGEEEIQILGIGHLAEREDEGDVELP